MVKLTRIYTGGGDRGLTSLTGGARVAKHDPRVAAYGTVDEANAVIGIARLHVSGDLDAMLARVQNDLFDLGADLSAPDDPAPRKGPARKESQALRITEEQARRLETEIDAVNANLSDLESFILPGGSPAGAHLHLARTVVRRAERAITELAETEPVNPSAVIYVNRLSDLLFVLARQANADGAGDVLWVPGNNR